MYARYGNQFHLASDVHKLIHQHQEQFLLYSFTQPGSVFNYTTAMGIYVHSLRSYLCLMRNAIFCKLEISSISCIH